MLRQLLWVSYPPCCLSCRNNRIRASSGSSVARPQPYHDQDNVGLFGNIVAVRVCVQITVASEIRDGAYGQRQWLLKIQADFSLKIHEA